jgi:uncharacterized caspase-like protein
MGMFKLQHIFLTGAVIGSLAGHLSSAHAQGRAEARTALVIGNGGCSYARLAKPANDACDMAEVLRGAGFEVVPKTDADQGSMKEANGAFGAALKARGGIGLIYFAGHGVQSSGDGAAPRSRAAEAMNTQHRTDNL